MATIHAAKCYEIQLENKPGKLGEVTRALASANVNILGIETVPTKNVVRLVTNEPQKTEQTLGSKNLRFTPLNVLTVRVPNKPGQLADISEKLGRSGINIEALFGYASGSGESELVLHVNDVSQAQKVLGS